MEFRVQFVRGVVILGQFSEVVLNRPDLFWAVVSWFRGFAVLRFCGFGLSVIDRLHIAICNITFRGQIAEQMRAGQTLTRTTRSKIRCLRFDGTSTATVQQ